MTKLDKIDFEVKRMRLEPGDMLIMTTPEKLSNSDVKHLEYQLGEIFSKHNAKVVVLHSGADLKIIEAKDRA